MTKEQVLNFIYHLEWQEEATEKSEEQKRIEEALGKYCFYQQDPDDYHCYSVVYHLTTEARNDFDSRNWVAAGRWCIGVLELEGEIIEKRTINV